MYLGHKVTVIGQGMEKYLSLSLGKYLVFKDSLQFLCASLQTLAENLLLAGIENFRCLRSFFGENLPEDAFRLLVRKGVYPYEYMDNWAKFKETKLPPQEAFYSKLKQSGISDEDYVHANRVWNTFGMKTMRDYHNLYLAGRPFIL